MLRPKNCKKCGGKAYMQRAGEFYDQQQREQLMQQLRQMQGAGQPTMDENISQPPLPAPTPDVGLNSVQEGIKKGIITLPGGTDYTGVNSLNARTGVTARNAAQQLNPNAPKTPLNQRLMEAGLGLKTFTTAASLLSGYVARNRDDQYDYKQMTGLGMMNPMPTQPFQPTEYNPYARHGGNPFSHYAKYGGNLKNVMRDFKQFSNDIAYEFGDGGSDSNEDGMMKKGGMKNDYDIDRMLVVRKVLPELLHFGRMMRKMRFQQGGTMNLAENPLGNIVGTPQQRQAANLEAQRMAHKLGLMDPSNMQIGQFLPSYVDPAGRPARGIMEKPLAPLPATVGPNDIYSEQGVNWYLNKEGDPVYFSPTELNQPRFKTATPQVSSDLIKRQSAMASLQAGGDIPNPYLEEIGMKDVLRSAKKLKVQKDGDFKALIPIEEWDGDILNYADKIKFVQRKGEQFIKLRGKLNRFANIKPEEGVEEGPQYPVQQLEKGGIYIKPENRGKFTDYCGGEVTAECIAKGKNSPSATIRKRATFAQNARKWNK